MSRLVARILLSIFMFPLAGLLYTVVVVVSENVMRGGYGYSNEGWMFFNAGVVTWAGIAVYWWLLWRTTVTWTRSRIRETLLAVVVAAVIGTLVGLVVGSAARGNNFSFAAFAGGVLAIMLWLVATVYLWRESVGERITGAATVVCPACGYNLTGLSEARCPECGSRFTLDELFAGQPARAATELE